MDGAEPPEPPDPPDPHDDERQLLPMLSQSATQLLLTRTSHGGAPAVQADVATATLAELAMVSDVFTAAWGAKRRVALMGAEALTVRVEATTSYSAAACARSWPPRLWVCTSRTRTA